MSRYVTAIVHAGAVLFLAASASAQLIGQSEVLGHQSFTAGLLVRGQSTDENVYDAIDQSDLWEIPGYREMAERLQTAETELEQMRTAIEYDGVNYSLASYSSAEQPEGAGGGMQGGPGGADLADVATQSQNPVGSLWMLWFQNDGTLMEDPGQGKRIFNTTVFQPVMPVQLTQEWKLINRPVLTFNSYELADPINGPFDTEYGLGDTMLIQWLSNTPSDSKMTFGFGWNWMFPTATDDALGTGKTSVGPSGVGIYLGDKIITGGILQQYFSIGGADSRERVSLMDAQCILKYRVNPVFSIGMTPNLQWDQVTGKTTMPIGLGFDTTTMASGNKPLRVSAEIQYYASHEHGNSRSFDPEWNLRITFVPIIPAPDWASKPLFGGSGCRHSCR